MGLWAGIKYALNSTLGTTNFKPLDKIFTDTDQRNKRFVIDESEELLSQRLDTTNNNMYFYPEISGRILVKVAAGSTGYVVVYENDTKLTSLKASSLEDKTYELSVLRGNTYRFNIVEHSATVSLFGAIHTTGYFEYEIKSE